MLAYSVLGSAWEQEVSYLAIFVGELEGIDQAKGLVDRSSNRKVVDSDLSYDAVRVDQEQTSQRNPLLFDQHTVVLCNAVVLVAQQRDVDFAQASFLLACVCPSKQAILAVCAGEDDAGATGSEVGCAFTKGKDLGRANESPGHGDETEDEPLLGGCVGC